MSRIFTTTLRLNLNDAADRRAWEHLKKLDKRRYRSYSKAIVAAVNGFFDRQERLDADPYLETRDKEDAFLRRVTETIETALRTAPVAVFPMGTVAPPVPASASEEAQSSEDMDAALDFVDSF